MIYLLPFALLLASSFTASASPSASPSFPKDFYWGVSTAAHQVEGNNTNSDWYAWEKAGGSPDLSGNACDFYHRYDSDFQLAQNIHQNAFRLSVEWARIEPSQGEFSQQEIQHYRDVLKSAHAHGMKTFVTLHHFTNPLWMTSVGGWLHPRSHLMFRRFVDKVVQELGSEIDSWITINEPNVYVLTGYLVGVSPPGHKDIGSAIKAYANLAQAHAEAYESIHQVYPHAQVGFAHHMRVEQPAHQYNPAEALLAHWVDRFWNWQFLDAIQSGTINFHFGPLYRVKRKFPKLKGALDFLGINYYTRDKIRLDFSSPTLFSLKPPPADKTVEFTGMEIYPKGLGTLLKQSAHYHWPIIITENGMADAKDLRRPKFICDHLAQVLKAMDQGVDVRGYFHWSLIDNFEWSLGYPPKLGLYEVNLVTQERTLRPSGKLYGEIAKSGDLSACDALH